MKFYTMILLSVIALAPACTTIKQQNGAEVRQVKLDQISTTSSKSDVFSLLGSPSTKSLYGQETWYYITNKVKKQLIKSDKVIKESVVAITFNEDIVDNVEIYDTSSHRNFALSDKVTPTAGRKLNVIEQVLGNVGKFNTDNPNAAIGSRAPGGGGAQPY